MGPALTNPKPNKSWRTNRHKPFNFISPFLQPRRWGAHQRSVSMKFVLKALILACCLSATTVFYARDEGSGSPDLANSWVLNAGCSPDILFARPLTNPSYMHDSRMLTWKRHACGLPVQWLVIEHPADFRNYYARIDTFYAVLSLLAFLPPSFVIVATLNRRRFSEIINGAEQDVSADRQPLTNFNSNRPAVTRRQD